MITNPPDDFQLLPTDQVNADFFCQILTRFHEKFYFNAVVIIFTQVFVLMQFDPGLEYKPNHKNGTAKGKDDNS